jgi:DNA-binding transcriptional MerR regulator
MQEVADASGLSQRTVRYYISQGLVPRPLGRGSSAYYTPAHIQRLARIATLREEQHSIAEIRELMQSEEATAPETATTERWVRVTLDDALELHVRADAPALIQALVERLRAVSDEWFFGGADE